MKTHRMIYVTAEGQEDIRWGLKQPGGLSITLRTALRKHREEIEILAEIRGVILVTIGDSRKRVFGLEEKLKQRFPGVTDDLLCQAIEGLCREKKIMKVGLEYAKYVEAKPVS